MNETYNYVTIVNSDNVEELAELKAKLECAMETIEDFTEYIDDSDKRIAHLADTCNRAEGVRKSDNSTILTLRGMVNDRDGIIHGHVDTQKWHDLAQHNADVLIKDLRAMVVEKDKQLGVYLNEGWANYAEFKQTERTIKDLGDQLADKNKKLTAYYDAGWEDTATIDKLRNQVEDANGAIKILQDQLKEREDRIELLLDYNHLAKQGRSKNDQDIIDRLDGRRIELIRRCNKHYADEHKLKKTNSISAATVARLEHENNELRDQLAMAELKAQARGEMVQQRDNQIGDLKYQILAGRTDVRWVN